MHRPVPSIWQTQMSDHKTALKQDCLRSHCQASVLLATQRRPVGGRSFQSIAPSPRRLALAIVRRRQVGASASLIAPADRIRVGPLDCILHILMFIPLDCIFTSWSEPATRRRHTSFGGDIAAKGWCQCFRVFQVAGFIHVVNAAWLTVPCILAARGARYSSPHGGSPLRSRHEPRRSRRPSSHGRGAFPRRDRRRGRRGRRSVTISGCRLPRRRGRRRARGDRQGLGGRPEGVLRLWLLDFAAFAALLRIARLPRLGLR